ncbi:protein unc-93 homolog A-like [Lineus longissimus]|uniref:protein unc-93 homolog A-like n=1 Tax=Lineus longissimus TaxID=88925 RepID=UPI00315D21AF
MEKQKNQHIAFKDEVDLPYKDKRKWQNEVEKWKEKEGMAMKSSYYYSTYNSIQYTTDAVPEDAEKPTSKGAVKNIVVLGVAFMFVYTAFVSLQSLQSTMNAKEGLGVASLCSIYTATLLSCFFAPWIIHKLKTKWTIILAFGLFTVYVIIHFYPKDFMLIPTSILLGFLMGPLWIAQSTYLTTTAYNYAKEMGTAYDRVVGKFNAVFCSVFQLSQIWGNILSAAVLYNDHTKVLNENSSRPHPCGAQDCGWNNNDLNQTMHVALIPDNSLYMLLSIYIGCSLMGVVIIVSLLDVLAPPKTADREWQSVQGSSRTMFCATVKMFADPRLHLLFPLVIFTGLEQGFIFGDFTKSYVNCALGVHNIGFTMITFGAITAASAFVIGFLVKHIKRIAIVIAGAVFHASLILALYLWKPSIEDIPMFYVVAACLGLCDAIWQTQSNTLFGVLFPEKQEAAFAAYRIFQSLGFALAFGYSYFLCVETKLYILASVLVISLGLYSVIEFRLKQSHHRHHHRDCHHIKAQLVTL